MMPCWYCGNKVRAETPAIHNHQIISISLCGECHAIVKAHFNVMPLALDVREKLKEKRPEPSVKFQADED